MVEIIIEEEKVTISNDINIGATIAYKNKNEKRPLVLLIMGTGTLDRDGNGRGFHSDLYKNLSDEFVNMGCVCVRYDKRGTHESDGDHKTSGLSDLVNDACNVIQYAKELEFVDEEKIIVCGHSEGSIIATLLTRKEELNKNLKGIILLSGACMGLKEALHYQNYKVYDQTQTMTGFLGWYLKKVVSEEKIEKQVNDLFEKANNSNKPRFFFRGAFFSTKYMQEHGALTSEKYVEMIKEFNGKCLAITGKADIQADYRELEKIASFNGVTVYTPDNVNHILREIDDDNNILKVKKQYKRLFQKEIYSGIIDQIN
ncbi:alpha/beta-hydrolase, partial [Anaeromyces robustus]